MPQISAPSPVMEIGSARVSEALSCHSPATRSNSATTTSPWTKAM
ncbi:MAG: hypothetical protein JWR00_291 [Rubritepida sp.]|nr:hypothetical protein [Rubritepida sp.]